MTEQKKRPDILMGKTLRIESGCGRKYVTLNFDDECQPFEVFSKHGKAGGCAAANDEAIARLLSWGLRSGAKLEDALKHLRGIKCHQPVFKGAQSCPDAVAIALQEMLNSTDKSNDGDDNVS